MQFAASAPGLLHNEGGEWVGYWDADDSIASWVSSALNNSLGWGRAGITFQQSSTAVPRVVFHLVGSITGAPPGAIGITYWSTYNGAVMEVELESAYEGNMDLVNHEAGHAYFFATHSPEGTASLMEPMEDPGEEWPSETDIAQVQAWLGTSANDPGGNPQDDSGPVTRWFPNDLPNYVTTWPVPEGFQGRMYANVRTGARVVLHAVHAATYEDLIAGDYARFAPGIDCYEAGLFTGAWVPAPGGERCVGLIAQAENAYEFADLVVGLAEVQIRS